jgi:hypothetical protein
LLPELPELVRDSRRQTARRGFLLAGHTGERGCAPGEPARRSSLARRAGQAGGLSAESASAPSGRAVSSGYQPNWRRTTGSTSSTRYP